MMNYVIIQQIGTAVLLASLIGLERERKYQDDGHCGVGGLRTFLLIGLLGALTFILSNVSIWFFVALTVGFLAFIIASYVIASNKDTGASWIAAILVYLIGVFCGMQEYLLATVVALLVLAVLYFKSPLHALAKKLNKKEFISTMKFIIIAFVVLPLLPNVWIGPYEFFNIYVIWLMVVFISGISFLSYIAIKLFGTKRGIGITGFLAGLISSTALTLSFSGESRKNKNIINPYVVAVLVASSAMFFRILFEVVVLNASLLRLLIIPMLVMGIIGLFSAVVFWFKKGGKISEKAKNKAIKMESPFSLKPALKFAAFFAWILFLTKFASSFLEKAEFMLQASFQE